jgi:hypothetical protein
MQWGGFPGGQVPPHFNRRTHRDTLRRQAARNSAIARVGPEGMLARGQVSEREAVDVGDGWTDGRGGRGRQLTEQEREEEREAVESARARVWRGELGESRQQQREAIVLAKEVDDPLDLDADPGWELLREARQRRAAQRASVAQESAEALAQGGEGRNEAQREARQRVLAARLLDQADEEAADVWRAWQDYGAEDVEVVESDEDGSVTEGVTDSDSDGTSVSLLCSALYAKCPYYVLLYMQSVLIMQCFICKVSLLCSALYAKRPYYLLLYIIYGTSDFVGPSGVMAPDAVGGGGGGGGGGDGRVPAPAMAVFEPNRDWSNMAESGGEPSPPTPARPQLVTAFPVVTF